MIETSENSLPLPGALEEQLNNTVSYPGTSGWARKYGSSLTGRSAPSSSSIGTAGSLRGISSRLRARDQAVTSSRRARGIGGAVGGSERLS